MADIVLVNPRFDISYWGLENALPLMGKKANAKYHVKFLCRICPASRRKYRDIENTGKCWWHDNWKNGNYSIPRNMGTRNLIGTYIGKSINTSRIFKK